MKITNPPVHGDCCKYYIKMGMRYGPLYDGIISGREKDEEQVYRIFGYG
jgi:hypothetical protein